MSIPIVGKCFGKASDFLAYLDGIQFGAWRPRYVVDHHTGAPDLKTWRGWQTQAKPVTDEQWMKNLAEYYGSPPPRGPADGPWQRGPHFMFTPKNYCVLSLPTVRGTHARSFNANSWCVEMVGHFDREPFDGAVRDRYVEGLAALHIAAGLQLLPFEEKVRGLHFHRDDPLTSKTCPGKNVDKGKLIAAVQRKMDEMTGGDHPDEQIVEKPAVVTRQGTVAVPAGDTLNVRAAASGKAPVITALKPGASVTITGEATNIDTKWLSIRAPGPTDGWVAARFITAGA